MLHQAGSQPETTKERLPVLATDGGEFVGGLTRLGGLSRLEEVLAHRDIDLVLLAFERADRGEFFGALETCYERGVSGKVHRGFADSVLVSPGGSGELVDVELQPWDPQDYALKRVFDVVFAAVGLLGTLPIAILIALAIKLDDGGPIFYSQERTAGFGEPLPVYKFRTMVPEGDSPEPITDGENPRITRVGSLIRAVHLDEIPQLWSILVGQMSVVGPRAVWTEEEALLEREAADWRKRWFVKPGLTGLAQIHDAGSDSPEEKLRYDLDYIRRRSMWFDIRIVIIQLWKVIMDVKKSPK